MSKPSTASSSSAPKGDRRVILLIAGFRLFKAALLIVLGLFGLKLLHHGDIEATLRRLAGRIGLDPTRPMAEHLLQRILKVDHGWMVAVEAMSFVYAALFIVEGAGLIARRRWAEWLTVFSTALLIPFEIDHLVREPTWIRSAVLAVNVAIAVYLFFHVRRKGHQGR